MSKMTSQQLVSEIMLHFPCGHRHWNSASGMRYSRRCRMPQYGFSSQDTGPAKKPEPYAISMWTPGGKICSLLQLEAKHAMSDPPEHK